VSPLDCTPLLLATRRAVEADATASGDVGADIASSNACGPIAATPRANTVVARPREFNEVEV
jgi:hypothetical protein